MTATETNTPEHDERLAREAAIAETARQERSASAKQKREAAKPKAKAATKSAGSMAEFVDGLLLAGITWTDLEARCKAEAGRRKVKTFASLGQIKAHVRYRAGQSQWRVTDAKGSVRMVLVAKPKATPAKVAKPSPKAKTGKPTGKRVAKTTENGRQTVEPVAEPAPEQTAA